MSPLEIERFEFRDENQKDKFRFLVVSEEYTHDTIEASYLNHKSFAISRKELNNTIQEGDTVYVFIEPPVREIWYRLKAVDEYYDEEAKEDYVVFKVKYKFKCTKHFKAENLRKRNLFVPQRTGNRIPVNLVEFLEKEEFYEKPHLIRKFYKSPYRWKEILDDDIIDYDL